MRQVINIDPKKYAGMKANQPLPTHAELSSDTLTFFYAEPESAIYDHHVKDSGLVKITQDGWVKMVYISPLARKEKIDKFLSVVPEDNEFLVCLIHDIIGGTSPAKRYVEKLKAIKETAPPTLKNAVSEHEDLKEWLGELSQYREDK